MKKCVLLFSLGLILLFAKATSAQEVPPGKNFIGAKVLFLEYGRANGVDSLSITNGLEVFYQRNINRYLSLAVPAQVGTANVIGDRNNRRILSLDGLVQLHWYKPEARFVPYVLGGGGVVWEDFDVYNFQIPLGGGLNIRVGNNSYINLQGEYRKSLDDNRDNLQAGIGYVYRLGKSAPDTDQDGIKDAEDACPEIPGKEELAGCPDRDEDGVADPEDHCPGIAGSADLNGCPDTDGDGVIDQEDQCPEVAGLEDLSGCPDADNDGIADQFDECPQEAGPPANKGCPIRDTDADGIPDEMDDCPEEAGTKKTMGCPDSDGDGIPNADDRCPDLPGEFAGCPDSDRDGLIDPEDRCPEEAGPSTNKGCPEIEESVREVLDFAMQAVQFETEKATLKEESFPVLDQIVDIMEQYPDYSLRISGHTDSLGDDEFNRTLSEERAKACYQYIVSKGVQPSRLSYTGYGEERPIADNESSRGRRLNRRVEFELYLN